MNGIALVMGNDCASAPEPTRLKNAQRDAERVSAALQGIGFRLFQGQSFMGQSTTQMMKILGKFSVECQHTDPDFVFVYFAGHAIESAAYKDLLWLGEEFGGNLNAVKGKQFGVSEVVRRISNGRGLSLVVSDACRSLLSEGSDMMPRETPTRILREALGNVKNTAVFLTTRRGAAAYDGCEEGIFVGAFEKILSKDTEGLSVLEFLDSVRLEVKDRTNGTQCGELLVSDVLTECFLMPQCSEEDRKDGKVTIEQLESEIPVENNGIQLTRCAYFDEKAEQWVWREASDFVAIQHEDDGSQTVFVRSKRDRQEIRAKAIGYSTAKLAELHSAGEFKDGRAQENHPAAEPDGFVSYAWRFDPENVFVFLAGGVGTRKINQFNETINRGDLMDKMFKALDEYRRKAFD